MFTTIWALFGSAAAPTLWVITARAGGLLGMVAAYLLASRLVSRDGRGPRWAAVAAGLIAAVGILITQDYWDEWFRGTSEPTEIATALWAVLAFLDGRRGWAFGFGVATSLLRPEAWPLVVVYALWLWWKEPRLRVLVVLRLISIPFFWFVPPWVGSGQPFLAAIHAEEYNGGLGSHPLIGVLGRGIDIQLLPVLLAGVVAVVFAWFDKPRDWLLLRARRWHGRVVGHRRRDDARRLSGPRAVLPAGRRHDLRARRRGNRPPGIAGRAHGSEGRRRDRGRDRADRGPRRDHDSVRGRRGSTRRARRKRSPLRRSRVWTR